MHKDIEILENFLAYDKSHLDDLYAAIPYTLNAINQKLYEKAEFFYLVYGDDFNDPLHELVELLDGNNFTIINSSDRHELVRVIPLYPEGSK